LQGFLILNKIYYQKIDKYKRKCRWNIFVGKFSRDFTNKNIPPRELPWGKKLKQSKKNNDVSFLPTELLMEFIPSVKSVGKFIGKLWTLFIMSITKGITNRIFRQYFPESSRIIHFPIALLIVIIYEQNHRQIEKSSVLFGGFLKKFN